MKHIQEDLKNLDSLIDHIENDLIGEHKEMKYIDEGIKRYAEAYHEMKLKLLGIPDVSNCDTYIHNTAVQFGGKCGKCGRSEKI